jgi:hypothetical protein
MGRPPIRKKGAFTAAERQQRRRQRLRREAKEAERRLLQAKNSERAATAHAAGWTKVGQITEEKPCIFREAGVRRSDLNDEDILAMLEQITELARERGLI